MKRKNKIIIIIAVTLIMVFLFSVPAFAISEGEVQGAIDKYGKEAVTGNIFVWFLCAIAFLKVSQKIDSFLAGLGLNVGHTGSSMLAEAMIAARGIFAAKQFASGSKGSSGGSDNSSGSGGFMSGGLVGAVGRNFTSGGVKKATGESEGGLGGKIYTSSVNKGGSFANTVIGKVATGNISSVGSISGEGSEAALMSYLGYAAMGNGATDLPKFSNVEIGGGRIMATEITAEHPEGIEIGMYHTDKYMKPAGEYTTITTADGTSWYKQYAQDAVRRTPYTAPNGQVAYREEVVKELPNPPLRKDKV